MRAESMTRDGLDAEGYIENCCAIEEIAPVFLPLLNDTVAVLRSTFGAKVHSIYLYGSVATGQAQLGQSDIDILVIFDDPLSDSDQAEIKQMAKAFQCPTGPS